MNANRDHDLILAAWLDEGPTDLPPETRRAILTALPTASQARRGLFAPWRLLPMNTVTRGAIAVLVAVVALGGALYLLGPNQGVGGPSPTPSLAPTNAPTPSPLESSALTTIDRSSEAGYSLSVPTTWNVSLRVHSVYLSLPAPLSTAWIHEGDPVAGTNPEYVINVNDATTPNVGPIRGHTVAELLASEDAWFLAHMSAQGTNERQTTIDGDPASVSEHTGADPTVLYMDAVVIHGSRAYWISMTASGSGAVELRAAFDQLLASIRWTT